MIKPGFIGVSIVKAITVHTIKKRRKYIVNREDYKERANIPYLNDDNKYHTFDVIYASEENRKNICIIDIHGGSYMFSTHLDNYRFARFFVERGFDVATLDYLPNNGKRSTKDLIDDVYQNIRYIFAHLKELELENDKFVITGDSAGGHISLLLALAWTNKDIAEKLGYEFPEVQIHSLLVNSPVYDFEFVTSQSMKKSGSKRMFGPRYNDQELNKLLSPKTHIEKLKTPIFVSACKNDFIRMQPLLLKEDLEKLNKEHVFMDIQADDKEVDHVHNVTKPELKESIEVNSAMIDFILNNM